MKQLIQNLKNGNTELLDVPVPLCKQGCLLIRTVCTVVSSGTERMLVEFGRANLLDKAKAQPERVQQVLEKIHTDGILPTIETVLHKLEQPLPLGYCNAGVVMEVGKDCPGFQVGDRVVSNGPHAEYVCVPRHLCAKIPECVDFNEAAFAVMGSIALQGIRNFAPELCETVVVYGLGPVGLLTAQILRANGCNVIGLEIDTNKIAIARKVGIDVCEKSPVASVLQYTNGIGADGVIIAASSSTDEIMHNACEMTRKRGRIVLVGSVGLHLRRSDFYKKEIAFRVSCSYGPGRYDSKYEQKNIEYPLSYVRWTEERNLQAFLSLLANRKVDVIPMISENVPLEHYMKIYCNMRKSGVMASLIQFSNTPSSERKISFGDSSCASNGKLALIGAGNYASSVIVPALSKANVRLKYICSAQGLSASVLAQKSNAEFACSDISDILADQEIGTVIIGTRHNLHAKFVKMALEANKNVFVEKPLCLNRDELDEISSAIMKSGKTVDVGFNRRFSPFAQKMQDLSGTGPINIIATVNAGFIPQDSWIQDVGDNGGRIIGETCHFIDLCSYLTGSMVTAVCANAFGPSPDETSDNVTILLKYANGSTATIHYFSNGSKAFPKERIEVFALNSVLVLDNWRKLSRFGVHRFHTMRGRLNKGQNEQYALLAKRASEGCEPLIPFDSIRNTTLASFAAIDSIKHGTWIPVEHI